MHPQEEARGRLVQPRDSRVDNLAAWPLGLEPRTLAGLASDPIVVGIKPIHQPETTVEHVGADKGARPVARVPQPARDRRRRGLRREDDAIVPHAVGHGQLAGHDADVRRQCQRHRRARVVEADASRGQPVDCRRKATPDPVRPERVDGDENDVGRCGGSGRFAPGAATGRKDQRRAEGEDGKQALHQEPVEISAESKRGTGWPRTGPPRPPRRRHSRDTGFWRRAGSPPRTLPVGW